MTEASSELTFKDGTKYSTTGDYKEKSLIVSPIYLSLQDTKDTSSESRTYSFYVAVVPEETTIQVEVFEMSDLKYYGAIFLVLILSLLLSTYCVFQTSHAVIKPLRILNTRMNEIMQEGNYNEVNLDDSSGKCKEINSLQG